MQRLRHFRVGRQDGTIFRDQWHGQLLRCRHEFAVVGTAAADQLQHMMRSHRLFVGREHRLRFLQQTDGVRKVQRPLPEVCGEHAAKLTSPQRWACPLAILPPKQLGHFCPGARQQQVGQHIGVNDDQGRPSRMAASISSRSKLWDPRCSRRALISASSSSTEGTSASRPASRQTIASLFRLRRCRTAAALSRAWRASGSF